MTDWDLTPTEGGPLHRLIRALRLPNTRVGFAKLGFAISLVTWVPLAVLALVEGIFSTGPDVPFVNGLGTHVRFLIAIPAFLVAEALFTARAERAIRLIDDARMVPPPEEALFRRAVANAKLWRDAWTVEIAVAILTALFVWQGVRVDVPGEATTWQTALDGRRTMAGWWYTLVSLPVFQFLLWRWCARILIWWRLLWRISRLDLALMPTHPDLAGGLGGSWCCPGRARPDDRRRLSYVGRELR